MTAMLKVGLGVVLACITFFLIALTTFTAAINVSEGDFATAIERAIQNQDIQIPGRWDINDPRGIDTFSDCITIQVAASLDERPWLFHSFAWRHAGAPHPCDQIGRAYRLSDYSRYWHAQSLILRIFLGDFELGLDTYRDLLRWLSLIAPVALIVSMIMRYGKSGALLASFPISIVLGFSTFSLGQSIGHAPGMIVGTVMICLYVLMGVAEKDLPRRAYFYTLLGSIALYLDFLNGNLALLAILICLTTLAPHLRQFTATSDAANRKTMAPLTETLSNLTFFATGIVLAVALRIIGYSISSGLNLAEGTRTWLSQLTKWVGERDLLFPTTAYGKTIAHLTSPDMGVLIERLIIHRWMPLHRIAPEPLADLFYGLGAIGCIVGGACASRIYVKRQDIRGPVAALALTALIIPVWYLLLLQHSIVHFWMTGRLVALEAGLGITFGILMVALHRQSTRPFWSRGGGAA